LPTSNTDATLVGVAKVMVSLPDDLLAEVDRTARLRGTTRSGLLAEAARRELERRNPDAMRAALKRIEARAARYGWPTMDDLLADKAERDERDMHR
jgi:predicted transcriptional regulator